VVLLLECFTARLLYLVLKSNVLILRDRCRSPPWSRLRGLTAGLRMGSANDLDTAKADFKAAWEELKAKTSSEELAAAYKAMDIRDDG
jgi:hypothetical protein